MEAGTESTFNFYEQVLQYRVKGLPPKDPKVREKLLICAGPWGKVLAYQKLKELGLEHRYEKPKWPSDSIVS